MNTIMTFSICGALIGGSLGYLKWKMSEDFKRVNYKVTEYNFKKEITKVTYIMGPGYFTIFNGYLEIQETE